ncbi:MAG TPA: hypothetical protein PLI09_02640 [Candidatus Hydrogenedentes bacterium]|nr:hypothetical protein [Candidatus Hydrogenedentota bacterium]
MENSQVYESVLDGETFQVIDFNSEGKWSKDAIRQRYAQYCEREGISSLLDLSPKESVHKDEHGKWVYPVMDEVIKGIETGDSACKRIGMEFIEEDEKFPFGALLKSNTARALRRCELNEEDRARIRKRIVGMLISGKVPHEYREYSKLLKKIGFGGYWPEIEERVNRDNPYVMRYYRYYKSALLAGGC